jgi:hypothetical protein
MGVWLATVALMCLHHILQRPIHVESGLQTPILGFIQIDA